MSHIHNVVDTDVHYKIDGITRTVTNVDETKRELVKGDHNSERFTFEISRYVDGHDFSECNLVQVHYSNLDKLGKVKSADVYIVDDLHIKEDDPNTIVLSWLISGKATKCVGTLNFSIRFACVSEDIVEDDVVGYAWNTTLFTGIKILDALNNSETVVEAEADAIATLRKNIIQDVENNLKPVKTVNGVKPDENGNVNVSGGSGTGLSGVGIPAGGKAGQVLCKNSDEDYDVIWSDPIIPEQYGLVSYDQDKTLTIT